MTTAIIVTAALVLGALVAVGLYWKREVDRGLRGLTDEQLDQLWHSPLDWRQTGWVRTERRRRGLT